ncbi:MAG: TRAP transporter fused permease subunit [Paracoccaceae bacterium]|nr:TRAP transporter fused permease subunit [Paracoccaceae bacterium]
MFNSILKGFFVTSVRRKVVTRFDYLLRIYTSCVAIWVLYSAIFSRLDILATSIIYLCLILVPSFLYIGGSSRSDTKIPSVMDWFLAFSAFMSAIYFISEIENISTRISLLNELSLSEYFFSSLIVFLSLEITRRAIGAVLLTIILAFIAYNLFGHYITGILGHGVITTSHFLDINVFTTDGLFGIPIRVAATYAFLFVLFGTFFEKSGGSNFFFNVSKRLTGKTRGAPAKISVLSSALFGTMSGSPTSDVVATGSITIPLMKKFKYPAGMAGGIEVAASTGGSLLPPVMGSAAFIMSEFTEIPYLSIVSVALFPALVYYLSLLIQVHFRSPVSNSISVYGEDAFRVINIYDFLYLMPLIGLIFMLVLGFSPTMVAAISTCLIWLIALIHPKSKVSLLKTIDVLSLATLRMIPVTAACASAGLVIGGITMTGLAAKFSNIAFAIGGDSQLIICIFAALVTIILGLGMPTPSAYILSAVLVAPTLVEIVELPLINVHLFLFYFAVLSAMTPPVAVAAYAASAISESNPFALAILALKLSAAAFILPFSFISMPSLLHSFDTLIIVVDAFFLISSCVFISIAFSIEAKKYYFYILKVILGSISLVLILPQFAFKGVFLLAGWALLTLIIRLQKV